MLEKSIKSAVVLSLVGTLTLVATSLILNLVLPALLSGQSPVRLLQDEASSAGQALSVAVAVLVVSAVLTAIGAIWLYRFFGPRYYGKKGLVMWAVFGVLMAVLLAAPDWVLGSNRLELVKQAWRLVSAFPAFFAARWLSRV